MTPSHASSPGERDRRSSPLGRGVPIGATLPIRRRLFGRNHGTCPADERSHSWRGEGWVRASELQLHVTSNLVDLIAHEAVNLEEDPSVIREQARDIAAAVQRISGLTKELTHYARHSGSDVMEEVELGTKLDEALKIARYATALQDLHVVKEYAARPVIKANPDGILHVFVNILTNAIHAMNGKGTLTLAIEWADDKARVTITTKPPEKGTGWGSTTS